MDGPTSDGDMIEHTSDHGRPQRPPTTPAYLARIVPELTVGAVASILALIGSWHTSLWTDESATISAARRSVSDLWTLLHSLDVVHGTYYLFMHYWMDAFGQSPFVLRLPSALFVGIAVGLTVSCTRRLTDGPTAVTAGLLLALLPRVTWAGMEARPYAASVALAAAATSAVLTAVHRPTVGWWVTYAVLLAAGCYVNVYVALLGMSHLCSVLLDRTVGAVVRRRLLLSAVGAAVLCTPLLMTASSQTGQLGSAVRGPLDWIRNVAVNQWFLGDTPTTTTGRAVGTPSATNIGSWWPVAAVILAVVSWLVIAYGAAQSGRATESSVAWLRRRPFCWTVPWVVVPTVVIVAYSLLTPVYSPRYLTFASPGLVILLATGLRAVPRRWTRVAVVVLLAVSTLPVYVSQRQLYAKNGSDWSSVGAELAASRASGDCVYFTPRYPGAAGPIGQTTRGISVAYPQDFAGLRDLTLLQAPSLAGNLTGFSQPLANVTASLAACTRVWVVQRNDYPTRDVSADKAVLTRAGLSGRTVWQGPLDHLELFTR